MLTLINIDLIVWILNTRLMHSRTVEDLTEQIWRAIGDDDGLMPPVTYTGPEQVLPAVFDVTGLAAATVGAATLAAAELLAARRAEAMRPVHVDRRASSAAFLSEVLFTPQGWQRPPVWDPIAGDYPGRDGWIKLHTNYRAHRTAVETVIGPVKDREAAAAAVASCSDHELQDAVVAAGGAAAAMNDRARWLGSPAGAATAGEAISRLVSRPGMAPPDLTSSPDIPAPLAGVRVLDLTRVIAGPVCTRFLAAYGADVLRVDPPGFEEVGALVPITSEGKHCTALDLTQSSDRAVFEALLGQAHVLVSGLRPGALEHLGYGGGDLHLRYPHLIGASLDAYGWSGPWSGRRGFDSLVQMSSGVAAAGAAARGLDRPVPLPAQALDHGTGYILAGAVCRALTRLIAVGSSTEIRSSLVGTANLLTEHPTPDGLETPVPDLSNHDLSPVDTAWGPARRVPVPGSIRGVEPRLAVTPGPLGRHPPRWAPGP
jgi:hypothetical protein